MKNILIGIGLLLILSPSIVFAQDITLRVEPGVAVPITAPQLDRFDIGGAVGVKGMLGITPVLDFGPSFSALVLPSTIDGIDSGTAFGLGGSLRLKRSHDHNNEYGLNAISPWIDTDLQYIRTGDLNRVGLAAGTGASVPTDDQRNLWIGPFARYQHVFQSEKIGYNTTDDRTIILGVGFEFGPNQQYKHTKYEIEIDRDCDGIIDKQDRCPDIYGPRDNFGCPLIKPVENIPTPTPPLVIIHKKIELQQKVQFDWDSFRLNQSEYVALDAAADFILNNPNSRIEIQGHASSEGQIEHNNVLAKKRANAVLDYLVNSGVPRENLFATGFGSKIPVEDNSTNTGRVANRRVEFIVAFIIIPNKDSK